MRSAKDYAAALRPHYELRAADVAHDGAGHPDEALFDLVTDIMREAKVPLCLRPSVRVEIMSERQTRSSIKLADVLSPPAAA